MASMESWKKGFRLGGIAGSTELSWEEGSGPGRRLATSMGLRQGHHQAKITPLESHPG